MDLHQVQMRMTWPTLFYRMLKKGLPPSKNISDVRVSSPKMLMTILASPNPGYFFPRGASTSKCGFKTDEKTGSCTVRFGYIFYYSLAIGFLSPIIIGFFSYKQLRHSGVTDPELDKLARYRKSKSGRTGKNAARDFHRYVHRDGKLFGVKVSSFKIRIRRRIRTSSGRRRHREIPIQHPIVLLSSWMEAIFKEYPNFFLGGLNPDRDGLENCKAMFTRFWERFRTCQPSHPIYQRTEEQRSCTIPMALHGDEGRGLARIPVLVLAYQVIIPYSGENELNSSKYPSCLVYISHGFPMNLRVDLKGSHFRLFV